MRASTSATNRTSSSPGSLAFHVLGALTSAAVAGVALIGLLSSTAGLTACGSGDDGGGGQCVDVCQAGARLCESDALYQVCQDLDLDGCHEWSQSLPCATGTSCQGGECVQGGSSSGSGSSGSGSSGSGSSGSGSSGSGSSSGMGCDQCSAGATECDGNGVRRCEGTDSNGCRIWGSTTACGASEQCTNGACAPDDTCCTVGNKRCDGNTAMTCVAGNNNCGTWSDEACGEFKRCTEGECAATNLCGEHSDCEDDKMCVLGRCRNVYGVRYRIAPTDGVLQEERKDGSSWDGIGSGTVDAYLIMEIDGIEYETESADNSLTPRWTETFDVVLEAEQEIKLTLKDSDLTFDDTIIETTLPAFPAEALRMGGWVWQTTDPEVVTVNFTIERIDN